MDSRFKFQNGRILDSKFKLDKIQDSKFFIFLGFKFQTTFLGFIFQTSRDSGFKFEIDGIQDSYLGLQGPIYPSVSTLSFADCSKEPSISTLSFADCSKEQRKAALTGYSEAA